MEPKSTTTPDFINEALNILKQNGEILVVIRFPYMAGSKDFFIIKNENDFRQLLRNRKPKDSVTVMKSFSLLERGRATPEFITKVMQNLEKPAGLEWLVIGKTNDKYLDNWNWAETKEELKAEIEDRMGNEVTILEEPDWISDETSINAYAPDDDGVVRPGAY